MVPVTVVDVEVMASLERPGERTREEEEADLHETEKDEVEVYTPTLVNTPTGSAPKADGDDHMRSAKPPCDGRDGRLQWAFMGD